LLALFYIEIKVETSEELVYVFHFVSCFVCMDGELGVMLTLFYIAIKVETSEELHSLG
jgi:hypothetical protein